MSKQEVRMALVVWLAKYDAKVERGEEGDISATIDSLVEVLHEQGLVIINGYYFDGDTFQIPYIEPLIKE